MMRERVPTFPNLVIRESVIAFAILAVLSAICLAFPLELLPPADPAGSDLAAKAPWFFVGFQEMLYHLPPAFSAVTFPTIAILFLFSLPYISWKRTPLSSLSKVTFCVAWSVFWLLVAVGLVYFSVVPFYSQLVLTSLFLIVSVVVAFMKNSALSQISIQESIFIYIASSYLMWTVIGIFFRTNSWEKCMPF